MNGVITSGFNLFYFTNRRRAKDSIMLIADKYGTDSMTVFVRNENVYIAFNGNVPHDDIDILMHYAEQCQENIEEVLKLEEITELYKGNGIKKFRV